MAGEKAIYEDSRKFMCDGETYESHKDAVDKKQAYEEKNFDVRIIEEEGKLYIYTRRVVTEIIVEGEAPA
ncbi:MAG: hypothetical protein GY866_27975 [Proteobacteria bacterium]|nr:hypothetical protein [Pseudomonadota bacterium]